MAVILDHGVRSMMEEGKDEFYYITAMNENYSQPSMPRGTEAGIIKGLYLLAPRGSKERGRVVRLLGSGAILPEVVEAARMLEAEWDVAAEVWSATSYSELARDARETERRNRTRSARGARRLLPSRVPARRRANHRSVRLCSRLPADDRLVCGRPVHCARHGRFWAERHPASAPSLLRSRPISHRDRRPRCACDGEPHVTPSRRQGYRPLWRKALNSAALAHLTQRKSGVARTVFDLRAAKNERNRLLGFSSVYPLLQQRRH